MIFSGLPSFSILVLAILRPAPRCYFLTEPHFYVVNRKLDEFSFSLVKYLVHASLDSKRMNFKYFLGGFLLFLLELLSFEIVGQYP